MRKIVLLFLVMTVAGCAPFQNHEPAAAVPYRPIPDQGVSGGEPRLQCREEQRHPGEPRAFFGFFHDSCLDQDGNSFVFVTGFDYLDRKSLAKRYGIAVGDRIVSFNGCPVRTSAYLTQRMRNFTATNTAAIAVVRGDKLYEIDVSTVRLRKQSEGISKRCADIGLRAAAE